MFQSCNNPKREIYFEIMFLNRYNIAMKYASFIADYLQSSQEDLCAFAKRAGVHRSTVYRALAGENLMMSMVERMVMAAGGSIEIVGKQGSSKCAAVSDSPEPIMSASGA